MNSHSVQERLAQGSTRGLGCANSIATEAATNPETLQALVAALDASDELVKTRASNALRKVQTATPELLQPFARGLVRQAAACTPLQARWNLAIILGGLRLTKRDVALAAELMIEALGSDSALMRVFALQTLVDLSADDRALRARVRTFAERALEDPSAAVRARARKLQRTTERA